jgi:hypothetical protein
MRLRVALVACFLLSSLPSIGTAIWQTDGIPVGGPTTGQTSQVAIPDGAGGAIIAWSDTRLEFCGDIFAQRVDANGILMWADGGVPLCTALDTQGNPVIISDHAGGAIVAWLDLRSGEYDIYAQRIDASGVVQWTADGVAVSTAASTQRDPAMTTNGAGGALVVWTDYRPSDPPSAGPNIFGTRLTAAGQVLDGAATGVAISTASKTQQYPTLTSNGSGGALIAWEDYRNIETTHSDIYATRTTNSFVPIDTLGLPVCQLSFFQYKPAIVGDGAAGAIITWADNRVTSSIYAQRVASTGVMQWTANGVAMSAVSISPLNTLASLLADGAGGAIVAWSAGELFDYDVYAQRVNDSGVLQWDPNAVHVCGETNRQMYPAIVSDKADGVVVSWTDERSASTIYDVYAQRVSSAGAVQWASNGVLLCGADDSQRAATPASPVSDGSGGAIVAWTDSRIGAPSSQIYAQRVYADGQTPTDVGDAPRATLSLLARPNPFAESTELEFHLATASDVSITVHDVAGRRVRTMRLADVPAGFGRVAFDGRDELGQPLSSGVYFWRVTVHGTSEVSKLVALVNRPRAYLPNEGVPQRRPSCREHVDPIRRAPISPPLTNSEYSKERNTLMRQ